MLYLNNQIVFTVNSSFGAIENNVNSVKSVKTPAELIGKTFKSVFNLACGDRFAKELAMTKRYSLTRAEPRSLRKSKPAGCRKSTPFNSPS
jgi:hypothetical protein